MARRRSASTALVVRSAAPRFSAPRPIIIRQSAAPMQRRKGKRRRSGASGGFLSGGGGIVAIAVASAVIGLAESGGLMAKLPSIPVVGRKGALAIAAYYYSKHGGGTLARDVAIAAAALSGYELASKGSISGEDY